MNISFAFLGLLLNSSLIAQFPVIGSTNTMVRPLHTLASGPRFLGEVDLSVGTATIYEADLTVHRVLNWPAPPSGMQWSAIGFITEDLFDTDPSTIEFVVQAYNIDFAPGGVALGIYREDGTEVFFQNPGMLTNGVTIFHGALPIFHHDGITKMVVHGGFMSDPITIYQLPGQLPCMDCTGSPQGSGLMNGDGSEFMVDPAVQLYPNPTASELNIVIPANSISYTEITILDASGKLAANYAVAGSGNHNFPIDHLANGVYSCHLSGGGLRMLAGRFVVSR